MVDKITTTQTVASFTDKINEIIDNLGGGSSGLAYSATCPAITIASGVATWAVTHNLGTTNVIANLYNVSTGAEIEKNIVVNSANAITVTFAASSNVSAGAYKIVVLGSGSNNILARNLGEMVASTVPLTDAWLHLLDGSLLSGDGIYGAFVDYIGGLVSSYPDLFDTEANWQSSVTTYGVCGKFVYTAASGNNPATVRLPKITGFTEGTTDLTALGDLVEAGLPNITGNTHQQYNSSLSAGWHNNTGSNLGSGALYIGSTGTTSYSQQASWSAYTSYGMYFDASKSNSLYGNSSTVQPQSIKVLYYIVVATATKTNIEVDIDEIATDLNEIATDLNSKADINLSNVTTTGNILMSSMFAPSDKTFVYTMGASGTKYYAKSNGWFCVSAGASTNSSAFISLELNKGFYQQARVSAAGQYLGLIRPALKGDEIQVDYANWQGIGMRFIYAVGSESEAS